MSCRMKKLARLVPRTKADRIGVFTTLLLFVLALLNAINTLMEQQQQQQQQGEPIEQTYMLTIGVVMLFVATNMLVNMYKTIVTDTSIYSVQTPPSVLQAGWRFCSTCEQNAPPRSHHCFTCNTCILKRHNHCFFLGKCAGHKNYRYYMCFVMYTWLGALLSIAINRHYYALEFDSFSLKTLCILFTPWLAYAIGLVTLVEFARTLTNMACLILFFLLFFYLIINMRMILNGQTWSEQARRIRAYKLAWRANLVEVFGLNWTAAMLNAFAPLRLPSDGTWFRQAADDVDSSAAESSSQTDADFLFIRDSNTHSKRRIV